MKKLFILCILFSAGFCGVFTSVGLAAREIRGKHAPVDVMLEFSLKRLKESMQKTMQKNERLSFENNILRNSIADLKNRKEALSLKRGELLGKSASFDKDSQLTEVVDTEARKKKTERLINIFERDIRQLKEKIRIIDDQLNEKGFSSQKTRLTEQKEAGEHNLSKAEKRLQVLKKQNAKPQIQIKELRNTQQKLMVEVEELQARLGGF